MDQQRSRGWEGVRKWPESPGVGQAEEDPHTPLTLAVLSGEPTQVQQRQAGSGTVCEPGVVTVGWEAGHCVSHTVPATQKAEGSLDRQHSKGTVPTSILTQERGQPL